MKKVISDFLYPEESKHIYDACHEVWKEFGGAFKEKIVDRALTLSLQARGLEVEDQKRIDVSFRGVKVGQYNPDKVINKTIILEIKCKPFLTYEDERQFWFYLKATEYKLGFLINFAPTRVDIKRRIYDKARIK